MTTEPIRSCAVIGAGWAGLSAAFALASAGKQVTLYEASPIAGGRARQAHLNLAGNNIQLDNGQHMLIGGYSATLALIEAVHRSSGALKAPHATPGLKRVPLQFRSSRIDLRRKGPGQLGLLLGILTAMGLSPRERLGIVAMSLRLRASQWQTRADETVRQLLTRLQQGPAVVQNFWEPLCIAALNTPISKACAQTFANVLHDSLFLSAKSSDFLLPKTDLGCLLPIPMLEALRGMGVNFRLSTLVRQLSSPSQDYWIVEDRQSQSRFDAVIVATSPHQAARLLGDCAPTVSKTLAEFEYESIQTVYLAWPASAAESIPPMRMLDQDDSNENHGQWLFAREPQHGLTLGAVVISAPPPTQTIANEELANRVGRQLSSQLGLPAPLDAKTVHEKRATFSCTSSRPVADHRQINGQALPTRLALAGDYCWHRYPATLESAVRSGQAAAASLV